jgi:tetratricopeptide (TPR) repeat protein
MVFRPLCLTVAVSLLTGTTFAQTGNVAFDSSRTTLSAPQADKPSDTPVITPEVRGDIFMAKKQYREAIEAFHQGSPKDPVLWNKTGIAYHQMMQLDSALKSYQKAVSLKKDYMEAVNNIGTVYYARRNYAKAITYYRRALKLAPETARVAATYNNLATALFARKQYKEAQDALETALRLDPNVFEANGTYGIMLEERSVPERAKFHYYMAKTYAKDGRNDLAIQYLKKSFEEGFKEKKQLEKDPEFAALRETQEYKALLASEQRVL